MSPNPCHLDSNKDDDDSLFGSPPPSPGRSPSPGLALPGSMTNASGGIVPALTKNVGTIALPGSQPNSELFMNPLASSLSLPPRHSAVASSCTNSDFHRQSGHAAPPPAPLLAVPPKPSRQRKRKKSSEPTIASEALQIADLDPSAPPPANFLRNQSALFGAAGLVAGVTPANIVHRGCGTTPSNPIVIEEEEPKQLSQLPAPAPRPRENADNIINGFLEKPYLTMPSKQEILASLVKERDIFPIIRNLIKLTAPSEGAQRLQCVPSTWSQRNLHSTKGKAPRTEIIGTHATGFPMKKRKLNRVPAGAADWDIPYPFANGEGPEEYSETWSSERSKQLVSQLISLIKSAMQKAAMIKYMKHKAHRQSKGKAKEDPNRKYENGLHVNKYYRPMTATYGVLVPPSSSRQSTPALDRDSSRSATPSSASVASIATSSGPEPSQESNSLDLLLSQLFAMTQGSQLEQNVDPTASTSASVGESNSPAGTGQGWLDDWMRMLDPAVDMKSDGSFPQTSLDGSALAAGGIFASDFNFPSIDFPELNLPPADPTNISTPLALLHSGGDRFPIDPQLLALSGLDAAVMHGLPIPSPVPTTTSTTSGTNPATPASANWDFDMLNIFGAEYSGNSLSNDGMGSVSVTDSTQGDWEDLVRKPLPVEETACVDEQPQTTAREQEENSVILPQVFQSNIALEKEDILRRVTERKALLELELNKVKLQLWETTVEQGALHHVLGHYTKNSVVDNK